MRMAASLQAGSEVTCRTSRPVRRRCQSPASSSMPTARGCQKGTRVVSRPSAGAATGQDPAELHGVEPDLGAALAGGERASGRAVEPQREGLPVAAGPVGDDVGDDPPVVLRRQHDRLSGRPTEVHPVHPQSRVRTTSIR